MKSQAVDVINENGGVAGAIVRRQDGDYKIRARVTIAADGVESQVARWAGVDTASKPVEVDTCAQYMMAGLKDIDLEYCHFFLGHEIAPRGYAWVFPKGGDSANVGIGIAGNISNGTAIDYLNKFVNEKFPNASVLGLVAGCVPVSGTIPDFVKDGFMVVGDAAHQNDPVSGGGIINAMIAGQIAGEVAGQAVQNGDVSRAVLAEYQKRWHRQIGRTFRHLLVLRKGILAFSDQTLNDIARALSKGKSEKISMIDMFWTALKNDPKLLLELRHLISIGWGGSR